MATVLVTGFEPFGGFTVNPSLQVAQALHGEQVAGHEVVAVPLPVVFGAAGDALLAAVGRHRPVAVLALGLADGRPDLTVERVAVNVEDADLDDNAGARPVDRPVLPDGPAAYFSTLPLKRLVAALRAGGIPASVSDTAGTFVCNHVFYRLMHALRDAPEVPAGFVHLPLLPEQAAGLAGPASQPSLPLATQVDGIRLALATLLTATPSPATA